MDNCSIERALIIKGRWLEMILSGRKVWEMRSKGTKVRGVVGLIESGTGLIVGQVEIIDSLSPLQMSDYQEFYRFHGIPRSLSELRNKYRHPWVLCNARRYRTPIEYTHPKGAVIWVKLDKETSRHCSAA